MNRTVIYARFSTDMQSDKSADDQIFLCRQFAAREGYEVVDTFEDKAISGATMHREGIQDLLRLARQGRYDVILVESLDRLSRSLSDLATLFDELQFRGIRLIAVHEGEANTMLVGMKGLFAQMFREGNKSLIRKFPFKINVIKFVSFSNGYEACLAILQENRAIRRGSDIVSNARIPS